MFLFSQKCGFSAQKNLRFLRGMPDDETAAAGAFAGITWKDQGRSDRQKGFTRIRLNPFSSALDTGEKYR